MIVERTQEGKEIARQREGYREGRPPVEVDKNLFKKFLKKQKEGLITVTEAVKALGISRSTWYNLAKEVC